MYRIEFENGAPVAVSCDTADEARAIMLGALKPNGQRTPLLAANGHGHKTDAVRGFLAKFPNAKPADVVAALKLAGVDVKANMVSAVKGKLPKTRRGVKAKRG